jgi:hypothetical protein
MPFPSALKKFSEKGSFELTDSQIFLENIRSLEKAINHLKDDRPEITFYQIHLNNVQLIPGLSPQTKRPENILSGAAVEHSPRPWNGKLTDVALVQMGAANGFNTPLNFMNQEENQEQQLAALKGALLSLLGLPTTWNSIELDHVFFHKNHHKDHETTEHFYNDLLSALAKNDSLKELSIKPFSLTKYRNSLVNFLIQNPELEVLHLQISEANRQDWLELSQILAAHLKLKSLNLDNSVLDANAYFALANLLDENYRVEITLPEPTSENLLKAYEPLKQRLSKPGLERFKEEHLSQDTLLQVAIETLETLKEPSKYAFVSTMDSYQSLNKRFSFLLSDQGSRAITNGEKEQWVQKVDVLPSMYRNHMDHLKDEPSLLQLCLDELVPDGTRTSGYVLLEKALETENPDAMHTLLNAKINLFERPDNDEEPFLVKALQSKGKLKSIVVEHIQQDQRLVDLASECLVAYPDLIGTLKDFKSHLDQYSSHLVKKDNQTHLIFIAKEVVRFGRKISGLQNPSDTRGKECAKIYLDLDESLELINNAPEITYGALRQVQIIMQGIKEDSMKALRGFMNTSFLHENVVKFVNQFDQALEASKEDINDKKDEVIQHKNEEINQLHENLERERAKAQEKQAKLEAKQAEMETKQTKLEAENAEIKKTLNSILQQINSNVHISEDISASSVSQDQERPESITGFFSRP